MAKYTMLLTEFLKSGGQLPASFELIQGFEDLFILRYCDKEIGFETPSIFELKLEEKARLYIQEYKKRIDLLVSKWTHAQNPTKVYYESSTTTLNVGEQTSKTTELPFNSVNADPSIISNNEEYENSETREHTREESGATIDETIRFIQFLNNDVKNIVEELLN